jgi:hypothetical protein
MVQPPPGQCYLRDIMVKREGGVERRREGGREGGENERPGTASK